MVTAGFIVEGDSEAILLKHSSFIALLASFNIFCDTTFVINAEGKNNLYNPNADLETLERRVGSWMEDLHAKGAEYIFFLIDFDNSDTCFTLFKTKVFRNPDNLIIIAKQALEAWYLADHQALSNFLQAKILPVERPESYLSPFDQVKSLRIKHSNRGLSDKKSLAKNMLSCGFSLSNAAAHPNCPSASYFLRKLQSITNQQQS